METENLSTAASRFALRSATELVGDKERRPNTPAAVETLAPARGSQGTTARSYFMDVRPSSAPTVVLDDYVSAEDRTRSGPNTLMTTVVSVVD